MKTTMVFAMFLALVTSSVLWLAGCTEEKIIEIAIGTEAEKDFPQGPSSDVQFENSETINIAEEVEKALAGTRFNRKQILRAVLNGASYGVLTYTGTTRWKIGGKVTVQRLDISGPEADLIQYDDVIVPDAVGKKITAKLTKAGVLIIDQALNDFVSGDDPVLRFVTRTELVDPPPSTSNQIEFDWRVWVRYQVIVHESAKIFDPL